MPLYDYRCHRCGVTFEVRQKFSDEPLKQHESCGGDVERLLSVPALQFKGSGWYVNDYGKGGKSNSSSAPNSGSESKPAEAPKSETKSSAAPAPSTDK